MRRARSQDGFTLIEVMVAAMLLVIGILGLFQLVDVTNKSASAARAHADATSVARRVAEAARGLTAADLTPNTILPRLMAAAPELADSRAGDGLWTLSRPGQELAIAASVCAIDDPVDGTAAPSSRDASYCSQPAATNPPDLQPDDYRRVTLTVTRPAPDPLRVRQVANVPTSSQATAATLPTVASLAMRAPFACTTNCPAITSASITSATFDGTTTNTPASVAWLLGGNSVATCPPATSACTGSGNAWTYSWPLGTVVRDTNNQSLNNGLCTYGNYVPDGVYQLGLASYDRTGAAGGSATLSVVLNRCQALAPRGFNATGRDANGIPIDTEWEAAVEGDIVGYRVYRGTSVSNAVRVCPSTAGAVIGLDQPRECTDSSPPSYSRNSDLYYGVVAVDRDPSGNLREGALSYLDVNTENRAPNPPGNFTAARGSGTVTLTWTLPSPQDPDSGDGIDSFRIYRRAGTSTAAPSLSNRYDREQRTALCSGSTCTWTDPTPESGTHSYWVSSVDTRLRESSLTTARTL